MTSESEVPLDIGDKYKTVLNALIQQNYHVMNDVYLDMFISHISGKNGKDYSALLTDEFTFEWIERSVSKIFGEHTKSVNGLAFTCQLIGLLTENPEHFLRLKQRNVYSSIQNGLNESSDLQTPSAKLALIALYQSMLKHDDGVEWLKTELAWKQAISYCIEDQTIYVVRRAKEFITEFLFRIANDENLCLDVIVEISRPITENVFSSEKGNVCVDSCDLQHKVTPSINIICTVLERYIQLNQKSSIAHHIIKTTKSQVNLWKLFDMTHDHTLFDRITQCLIYVNFGLLVDKLNANEIPDNTPISVIDFNDFGLTFLNFSKICILRNQNEALLNGSRLYYAMWKIMGDRVPEEIILGNQLTKFENQVILFQILPLISVMFQYGDNCYPELLDDYVMKLFHISTEHTLRICYSFRNSVTDGNVDLYDLASKAIRGILSIIHILHRDRAVIVFQALCHIIKGVFRGEQSNKTLALFARPTFMSAVLTGLYSIVKKYRITWKDSYESVGLLNCMLYSIEDPNLSPRLAVEALKLAQLSVEHFMAPNLALLVDTLSGSDMQKLGPMIVKRLHDSNWEVRDSVLELLTSIANISLIKFPAFQEHILSNGLCPLVVDIAKNDSEYYVRASALSCISQMVPVNMFWEQCFSSLDLITYLIEIAKTEFEGVVRKEAVSLITCIYENQKVPSNQLETIYEALSVAATHDLFWEVKVKAIEFWHCVIKRQLQYQGVIDGTFPSVTFSKENKKIVMLTQKEITLRLTKVLVKLSTFGCLGVLLASLEDQDDLLVVKKGVSVIRSLTEFLDKYNYWEEVRDNHFSSTRSISNDSSTSAGTPTTSKDIAMDTTENKSKDASISTTANDSKGDLPNSDDVIQAIVSAQDINLLSKAYENQMNVDADDESNKTEENAEYFKCLRKITPEIFLDTIKTTDLNHLLQTRTEWLAQTESFSSLLNDMSYSLQAHEQHDADCY
ncbi:uncharacterized protein LOC129579171 [Sitodiplosis mosellana]|uniref:uncharacterized protein LOC129579171 n=1 Tax=Sitodiplosis mosellana TaxID=263140 RepID=UPI0024445FD7|nr:uncharacterized protein LOC129579171 [Sitodiplosis mosellana]